MGCLVADSSFYILFYQDLEDSDSLHHILCKFDSYVGSEVKRELDRHISKDEKFAELVNDVTTSVDFKKLLRDFLSNIVREFPHLDVRIREGEYEVMGLSYLLKQYGILQYMIMDDKQARNFVMMHLESLRTNLVWTPEFFFMAHSDDNLLKKEFVVEVYTKIRRAIHDGKKPLHLTEATWDAYVKPLLIAIEET